jgi:hypothetical protein
MRMAGVSPIVSRMLSNRRPRPAVALIVACPDMMILLD